MSATHNAYFVQLRQMRTIEYEQINSSLDFRGQAEAVLQKVSIE